MQMANLTNEDRRLLIRAFLIVSVSRVTLSILPMALAQRAVGPFAGRSAGLVVGRVVWAIKTASRYIPRATCLTQAVAAHALLTRAGYESCIEIGVAKRAGGRFEAHAWVICGDIVVIGGPDVARYVRLTALSGS